VSFVQEVGATETSAATTIKATMTTSAGHLLAACIVMYTGATQHVSSVTDDGGNTWALWSKGGLYVSGHNCRVEIWTTVATAANTSGVTATFSTSLGAAMSVQEHSLISGIDQDAGTANTSTSPSSGATAALAGSTDLAIGCIGIGASTEAITSTGSGYTACTQRSSAVSSANVAILSAYKYSANSAGETYTGTLGTAKYWGCGVICFTPSGAAPASIAPTLVKSQAVNRSNTY